MSKPAYPHQTEWKTGEALSYELLAFSCIPQGNLFLL
jgi:hypothetical protein